MGIEWYSLLEWVYYLAVVVLLVTGWLLNLLGLPGLWLMLAAHIGFGLATGWNNYVGWPSVITIFVLAVLAEIVEFAAGAAGSAKAGGTKRGMIGSIVGGLLGAIGGTFIPVPVLGTIIGAVAGSFAGAAMVERMIDPDNQRAIDIGIGAAKGRFWGILIKCGFGIVIGVVSLITALPIGGTPAVAAPTTNPVATNPATTNPATAPATQPLVPATLPSTTLPTP